ncbi:hypothetical protein Smp_197650 [Schistosoma mansoni]|nr:hypothetical protein Smp_197650 [Schistosoma mansoni]|eukprot:XP_018651230.1 hypothetical protein Smp_197650 [Schistosoma mansoni]
MLVKRKICGTFPQLKTTVVYYKILCNDYLSKYFSQ